VREPRFTAAELRLIRRLDTPRKVQRWLAGLRYNHEVGGKSIRTFRVVRRTGTGHCLEASLSAATILEQHGYSPILLSLESWDGLDHVPYLFREAGRFGAVARSRDPGLHGRKPVYRTLRQMVLSYFEPFIDRTGRITGYTTFDLRDLRGVDWRLSERNVWKVERALIALPHTPLPTSDAWYHRVHVRYMRYIRRYPGRKPVYYDNRHEWL
jgi:hypothetical protein